MNIKPVKRINVSDQVFEQMKDLIVTGEWVQGMHLPSEGALADMFGVSRVTVRQGIHRLVALGLAKTRPGEGTFISTLSAGQSLSGLVPVAYLTDDNMVSVLEFRKAIEGFTAELAAKKADAADIDKLEAVLSEMKRCQDNIVEFSEADYKFHYELAVISRNPLILESYNLIGELFRSALKSIVFKRGHSQGLYYHQEILDSIISKDTDRCRTLMTQHIDSTYADMLSCKDTSRE